jgi:hypothetical protein
MHRCRLAIISALALTAFAETSTAQAPVVPPPPDPALLMLHDPLVSDAPVPGESMKESVSGAFTESGWRSTDVRDGMLKIGLSGTLETEGELTIDLTDLDWIAANTAGGDKIHFLNMFSSPLGDHHAEDGATDDDAFWTLRGGKHDDGKRARYGNVVKLLGASRGGKRAPGSDYFETIRTEMPRDWQWEKNTSYHFRVAWSASAGRLAIWVNDTLFYDIPWRNQVEPLRYIFIGKARDFSSFVGPVFKDLRIYSRSTFFFPSKKQEKSP